LAWAIAAHCLCGRIVRRGSINVYRVWNGNIAIRCRSLVGIAVYGSRLIHAVKDKTVVPIVIPVMSETVAIRRKAIMIVVTVAPKIIAVTVASKIVVITITVVQTSNFTILPQIFLVGLQPLTRALIVRQILL